MGMFIKETSENFFITLADFPEHPPHRFVHEIVRMYQEDFCKLQRIVELSCSDERVR